MRTTYRVLAMLIALGVVVQAAVIAVAWFIVLDSLDDGAVYDKNSDNWAQTLHGTLGMMIIPVIALLLLIVSFFAHIPGGVKWAAITLGVTLLQIVLAYLGLAAPIIGALHGINAFALAFVASIAMRKARLASTAPPAPVPAAG
jgi:succinate dehydrogenase/fumarate reductase cytochrome b subunit